MKNLLFYSLTFLSLKGMSQQYSVDFFCGTSETSHYRITADKLANGSFNIKVVGHNSTTITVTEKENKWKDLKQKKKENEIITKAEESSTYHFLLSHASIDAIGNWTDGTITVGFIDTLNISNVADIDTKELADALNAQFKLRFESVIAKESCKPNLEASLRLLAAKIPEVVPSSPAFPAEPKTDAIASGFGIGLGVGPVCDIKRTYDYYVSPYDTTLQRTRLNTPSFVASLLITWNPIRTFRRHVQGDPKGTFNSPEFDAPGYWGLAAGFNFAAVSPSSMEFNFRLSGGGGVLANLGGGFQLCASFDLTQQRVLHPHMEGYLGQKYPFDDLTNLNPNLFTKQFIPGVSMKFVYRFKAKEETVSLSKLKDFKKE